ncbi:acyltransferase family protein [Acidiphilium sp.]|uniref:acyltransferase family protein n=1 Tax=Acidiphilium sp. TaxID=527 RepID=UPI003D0280DD
MSNTRHYTTLDGMRGIAAIAVVMFHAKAYFGGFYPRSAYLAVDLFFCLSGFVIAHAYDARLANGLRPLAFMRIRLLRLYPLYLAGTSLAILAIAAALFIKHDAAQWTVQDFAIAVPAALFMIPAPLFQNIFALNVPAWSLFYELVANIIYATSLFSLTWALRLITAIAAIAVIAQTVMFGHIDQGTTWPSTLWALGRVFFSFPLGVMLYRLHLTMRHIRVASPWLLAGLAALMLADPTGNGRIGFDIGFVLLASPALVLLGCLNAPSHPILVRAYKGLGLISYPIYVIHFPVILLLNSWERRHGDTALHHPLVGGVLLVGLIGIAWIAGIADARIRYIMKQGSLSLERYAIK